MRKLHWAAQTAAGVGRTLLPKQPDDSQESFTWSDAHGGLLQAPVAGRRAGIRFRDLTLLVVEGEAVTQSFAMRGHGIEEGFAFFERIFGATLQRPAAGMPEAPSDYDADASELAEAARLYAEANAVLTTVRDAQWSAVRCWPHHFDIATLLTHPNGNTLGVGLAPADGTRNEPYYYVTPWPYPDASQLPKLAHGEWNTNGWTGAILPAAQGRAAIELFLREAIATLR
ncbi:MAG TPA: hypothetical protein VHW00_19875 [Thermoanaerobaculia bacterium]|nr:hypothetical protein [Thermoanaerobaculia bacterium]